MTSVIDLAAYRARRAQAEGSIEPRPPDGPDDDQIQLLFQPDGSYQARITGIPADDTGIAIEAMVDAIKHLAADTPLVAIKLMATAIKQLSTKAKLACET